MTDSIHDGMGRGEKLQVSFEMAAESRAPLSGVLGLRLSQERGHQQAHSMKSIRKTNRMGHVGKRPL